MIESKKSNFERSVLVGVVNSSQNEEKLNEFLEELEKPPFLIMAGGFGKRLGKLTENSL